MGSSLGIIGMKLIKEPIKINMLIKIISFFVNNKKIGSLTLILSLIKTFFLGFNIVNLFFYVEFINKFIDRMYYLEHGKLFKLVLSFIRMLKIKKLTEVIGKKVYTDTGDYFGEIEESNLVENKVESWRIRVVGSMGSFLGGARGVIIPHQFVRAIGDVVLISRSSLPLSESNSEVQDTVDLSGSSERPMERSIM